MLDFNASRRYSHHWSYVKKYKDFLENLNEPYEIWIPKNAHPDIVLGLGKTSKTILQSNAFGYEKDENFYYWFVFKIIDLLLYQLKDKISGQKLEILKKFFSRLYINTPYKQIRAISSYGIEINLVFPTMDSLAFRLVERCLNQGVQINKICFRLGSNYKDGFKVDDIENRLDKLITKFPDCDIALGYETIAHKQILLKNGLKPDNLYWTPAPPAKKCVITKLDSQVLTLGFLGVARPSKGFVEIPELLKSLSCNQISFKAIAQEALYPWAEYRNTIRELVNFSGTVTILPANISNQELQSVFKTIDILILPYNPDSYKLAGSGLLFDSADLSIPIVTKKGVAFEWDVKEYSLGFVYENSEDFAEKISNYLLTYENNYGFKLYNSDRRLAIKTFLSIGDTHNSE